MRKQRDIYSIEREGRRHTGIAIIYTWAQSMMMMAVGGREGWPDVYEKQLIITLLTACF